MKLWTPTLSYIEKSELTAFKNFVEKKHSKTFGNYQELWQWSVDDTEDFWVCILEYFQVLTEGEYSQVLSRNKENFIGAKWFEGIKLSYSEHIFRNYTDDSPAIIFEGEGDLSRQISWKSLKEQTLAIQQYLIKAGVEKGDCVAGLLNNSPETIAIFLAVNSIGAIWSCCSPDFGSDSVFERFQQISPKILFANKKYIYNGKAYTKSKLINDLAEKIESIDDVVVVEDLKWRSILALTPKNKELNFERVAFNDPIWILFSSGTTGVPKAITHSTGGNLLEHLKALALHQNVQKGERFFWYSTTGWMMWNYAVGSMLLGTTLCLYEGSLSYPTLSVAWKYAVDNKVDHFGAGAAFYIACAKKQQIIPHIPFKTLGSTGSPLPPDVFLWLQDKFPQTQIISLSGGTDVCSAFLSGCPWLPVYSGEIQCRTLGSAIEALNDTGQPVLEELGELVINKPMPSMPLYFWKDKDNKRYQSSYFDNYPGKWYHGDWIKITEHGGVIIFGRSDATLNRGGVRIGTAEIYNGIEDIKEIKDSLVVCIDDNSDGSSDMYLFVQMNEGHIYSSIIKNQIKTSLKAKYSARHVPNKVYPVPDIPYTMSGKKLELPVKRLLMGVPLEKAVTLDAVKNPVSLNFWVNFEKE